MRANAARQLPLELPHVVSFRRDDFLESRSNEAALATMVELAIFIPLIISTGGNAGSQSSTQRVPVAELRLRSGETVRAPLEASTQSPWCATK